MPKFTEKWIAAFAPASGQKDRLAFDVEVPGLGVRATSSGAKVFLVQHHDSATDRKIREPLGAWGAITLAQARTAAQARLGRVAAGVDVAAEKAARKAADVAARAAATQAKADGEFTLKVLVETWGRLHLANRSERYRTEAKRAILFAFAGHAERPAATLDRAAVLAMSDALVGAGKAPIAARTAAYGRACYGWACKRGRLSANPFADMPVVAGGAPSRDRVMTDAEVGAVWRAAGGLGFPFGSLVRLLMLTAARREEIAGMRWSEISADGETWVLPKERAKNGKAHATHLSPEARAVLATVPKIDGRELIFSTTGRTAPSGFSKAKLALDAAMAREAVQAAAKKALPPAVPWTFHDFRRTAVTWLAGAGFPPHVADRLLNHVGGSISGVAATYQKHAFLAEREVALTAWGKHVAALGAGATMPDAVVDLTEARRKRRA